MHEVCNLSFATFSFDLPPNQAEPGRATLNMFQFPHCRFFKLWSIRPWTLGENRWDGYFYTIVWSSWNLVHSSFRSWGIWLWTPFWPPDCLEPLDPAHMLTLFTESSDQAETWYIAASEVRESDSGHRFDLRAVWNHSTQPKFWPFLQNRLIKLKLHT